MKVEGTEGTDSTVGNSDAGIEPVDPRITVGGQLLERGVANALLSNFATNVGARSATLTFRMEIKGAGAAGTAPAFAQVLKAMGMTETVNAGVSVAYAPSNTAPSSFTTALYEDGIRYQLLGCRATGRLIFRPGQPIIMEVTVVGAWDDFTTASLLSPTYDSTVPPPLLSAAFSLDSYSLVASELDIDVNNTLELREDFNTSSGYISAVITDRSVVGRLVTEAVPTATKDWFGLAEASTQGALTIKAGATAGNIITVTAPKVQWSLPTQNAIGGRSGIAMDLRLNRNSGGDEIVVTFT